MASAQRLLAGTNIRAPKVALVLAVSAAVIGAALFVIAKALHEALIRQVRPISMPVHTVLFTPLQTSSLAKEHKLVDFMEE